MTSKNILDRLRKEGLIISCPIDRKSISRLIHRAHTDLRTAKRNVDDDEECAYNYAYNAMLRSGLALVFSEGYRPEIKSKHRTVVRFASGVLGNEFKRLTIEYDAMRKKRNQLMYEPDMPCSNYEAREAIKTAKVFVNQVAQLIQERHPGNKFDFSKE